MGFAIIKTSIKDQPITLLFFAAVLFLSIQEIAAGPVKTNEIVTRNFCRNHIFSPRCRGQQKRDIISRPNEDYRLPPLEDISGIDRTREIAAIFNSPTLLGELLRKTIEASPEYDSETNNYLK